MVLVVVPPVTNAVRAVDCPTIILPTTDEVTVTATVFTALLLPQPAVRLAAAIAAATQVKSGRNFILPPPKQTHCRYVRTVRSIDSTHVEQSRGCRHQKVRLTVKRNVVFGSK